MELVIWWIDEINSCHTPFLFLQISLAPVSDGVDLIDIVNTNG
jgi:hypothetical protein